MPSEKQITIRGAKEHNLKDVSVEIPRNQLVVFTGLSGSGKSSLAFDTIFAEGQRRYLESLSAYARQFLEQMKKPEVDSIEGLSPSISIEQKNISRNPRSTVGTITEVYDYLRLLYSRVGTIYCPQCHEPIKSQTIQQITDQILKLPESTKFAVMSPLARGKKGEFQKELSELRSQGYIRARIDGVDVDLSTAPKLKKNFRHDISIYIDRLILKKGMENRLAEAIEMAAKISDGLVEIQLTGEERVRLYSLKFACPTCGTSFPALEPRNFSFNSPHGACEACDGIGERAFVDPAKVILDTSVSLRDGAISLWGTKTKSWLLKALQPLAEKYNFSFDVPFQKLPEKVKTVILQGTEGEKLNYKVQGKSRTHQFSEAFPGIIPLMEKQLEESTSSWEEEGFTRFLGFRKCPVCEGSRLKKDMLCVKIGDKNIAEYCALNIEKAYDYFSMVDFSKQESMVAEPVLREINSRLKFLVDVGLPYLSLSRSAATLSGGEAQRIRLATQIGSNLVGVLYILDEPSIGLHQRDNSKLIQSLERLRDLGNSLIVVEHDEETIERADFVVDLGPGAGEHGGKVIFAGAPSQLKNNPESITGKYLSGRLTIEVPAKRRAINLKKSITISGANQNNLKNLTVSFPLGVFTCITGVSGSGKSTLVLDTLLPALLSKNHTGLGMKSVSGLSEIDKVIHIDQSPIGRTPRSNPATYTGLFTDIRTLFAFLPEAKVRGYSLSRFSFNVAGGRCDACSGDGTMRISMHFLPDVFVMCEVCRGKRYNRETLDVQYRGKSIAEVLDMSIEEAYAFFERVPQLKAKLGLLNEVGLSYLRLGQNAVTLSGGEAQRVKLSKELSKRSTGRTLYILDEPTTGLHFDDVKKLLYILQRLTDQGNTVLVIEHNLDVIKQADYVIDLGPEGGDEGGQIVATGTPEEVAGNDQSVTGAFLKKSLKVSSPPKSIATDGKKNRKAPSTLNS